MSDHYEKGNGAAIHAQDNPQHNIAIGTASASPMSAQRYSGYMQQPEAEDLNMAVSSPVDDSAAPQRTRSVHGSGPPLTNMVDVAPVIRRGNVSHSAQLHAPSSLGPPPPHTMGSWPRQPAYHTPWLYQGPSVAQGTGMAQQFPPLHQPHPLQPPTYLQGQESSSDIRHRTDDRGVYGAQSSRAVQHHSQEPGPMTDSMGHPAHTGHNSSMSFPQQTAWSQPHHRDTVPRPAAKEPLHYPNDPAKLPPFAVPSSERARQAAVHHSQAAMERPHITHEGERDDAPLQRMAAAAAAAAASLEELPGVRDPSQQTAAGAQSPAAIKSATMTAAAARNAFTKAASATRVATQRLVRARAAFNEAEEQAATAPQGTSSAAACTREEALIDEEVAAEQLLHDAAATETAAEMAWRSARQRLHAVKSRGEQYSSQVATLKEESAAAVTEADGTAAALSDAAAGNVDTVLHTSVKTDEEAQLGSPGKDSNLSNNARQTKRQMLQRSKLRQAGSVKMTRAAEAASSKPSLSDQLQEPSAPDGAAPDSAANANESSDVEQVKLKRRGRQVDPNSARQKRLRAAAVAAETAAAAEAAGINPDSDGSSRQASPSPSASRQPSRSPSGSVSGRVPVARTRNTRPKPIGAVKEPRGRGRGRGRGGRGRGRGRSARGRGRGRAIGNVAGIVKGRGRGSRGRWGKTTAVQDIQAGDDFESDTSPEDQDNAEMEQPPAPTQQQELPQQVHSSSLAMALAQEQKLLASQSEEGAYRGSAPPALMQSGREPTEG